MAPGVDEARQEGERPLALAVRLARCKADAVAVMEPDAWVIGCDQVAVRLDPVKGEIAVGKPGTKARCREQLRECSGQPMTFITAVALVRQDNGAVHEFIDSTRVTFRTLDEQTIERYVELESPLDCAGGFKSEGLGITLCESIDSIDPTALIGLPLIRLSSSLRGAGFDLP